MKATQALMEEHRVIERIVLVLETAARNLEQGQPVRPGLFIEVTDFVRGFADGCHHQKEEGILFKSLEESGMPVQGSPIGVMLFEHEQSRQYTRGLREAAQQLESGDKAMTGKVIENALGYAELLRQHIMKEDQILFPMADQMIPPEKHEQIWEDFEHFEHEETGEGVHEKYLALADRLTKEVGI